MPTFFFYFPASPLASLSLGWSLWLLLPLTSKRQQRDPRDAPVSAPHHPDALHHPHRGADVPVAPSAGGGGVHGGHDRAGLHRASPRQPGTVHAADR